MQNDRNRETPTDPADKSALSFADFLPDDRTEEQKQVDTQEDTFAALLSDAAARDRWPSWRPVLQSRKSMSKADAARFDIALRQALSRHEPPARAVCGLIFTEMDWWEPKKSNRRKYAELAQLRERLRIDHLKPAPAPTDSRRPVRRKGSTRGRRLPFPPWVLWAGFVLLLILLN